MRISHCDIEYDLSHLRGRIARLGAWTGENGHAVQAEVEVRFSAHCYTEASMTAPEPQMWAVKENNGWRIFNPPRHVLSMHLPGIVEGLIQRPNRTVQRVSGRHNFKIFQIGLSGLAKGERYYVFFKLDRTPRKGLDGFHQVRMSVESAYPKDNIVAGSWRPPFGRVIEEVLGLRQN